MLTKKSPWAIGLAMVLALLPGNSVIAQDDDDFIILDDRGLGESEEGDVELSGRSAPVGKTRPQAGGDDGSGEGPVKVPDDAQSDKPPPKRFEPTERVSEDLSVSFPADI